MNKKIILEVVSSAMLAVIITAVLLNRNSIISKYSNGTVCLRYRHVAYQCTG